MWNEGLYLLLLKLQNNGRWGSDSWMNLVVELDALDKSLFWCLGQIHVARYKLVKLTWNTQYGLGRSVWGEFSPGFDIQIYKRRERCNTWEMLLFHIIFRDRISDLHLGKRNQRKNGLPGEKKFWKPLFETMFKCILLKRRKLSKLQQFFANSFFSEWRPS